MKFEIKNRIIKLCEKCITIGDNSDYIAEFIFDKEWNGVTKTARFISCNNLTYVDILLENDQCKIPCEILKRGFINVGVYSAEMTTTFDQVYIKESIKETIGNVCEPTPDVYEQLLNKLDNIISGGGITEETDPTVPNCVKNIAEEDIKKWNKVDELEKALSDILIAIQNGVSARVIEEIEQLIVSYFENKAVGEIEE